MHRKSQLKNINMAKQKKSTTWKLSQKPQHELCFSRHPNKTKKEKQYKQHGYAKRTESKNTNVAI